MLNPVSIVGLTATLLLGITSFVVPLYGLHRRLEAEKERLVSSVVRRLSTTFRQLHQHLDAAELEKLDGIK